MNEGIILELAKPYVKDGAMTYDDFDKVYDILSLREQYVVADILYKNGINLVDSHVGDNAIVLDIDGKDDPMTDYEDADFEEDHDDSLFKDNRTSEKYAEYLTVNKQIRQSNEVLCSLIQRGSRQAAQDLCVKNKDLVYKYVTAYMKRYGNHLDFEDLAQVGFIGLLKAAEKFNIAQGTFFSTYAVYWIKQSIARDIMENGYAIRIPAHMMERINKVVAADNRLIGLNIPKNDRICQIAQELDLTEKNVRECFALKNNYLSYTSLDAPVTDDQDAELGDFIPTEDDASVEYIVFQKALRQEMEAVMKTLTPKEQTILRLRFGWDDHATKTLEEVGDMYGVTRERIRQIEQKAMRKMRHPTRLRRLAVFMEE